ncbi:hypothetical protein [Sphaerisporangium sp. B11E5]|uniref:hypothetical protein n=1 Tax=Sphaerisporangium sp. B11E5 TaxID=3153563 RepID=UPI00325FC09E
MRPTPQPLEIHLRKRPVVPPPKRRHPLDTLVVVIVLSTVIASIASVAFAVR